MKGALKLLKRIDAGLRAMPRPTPLGWRVIVGTVVVGVLSGAGTQPGLVLVFGLLVAAILVSLVAPVLNLRGVAVEREPPGDSYAGERFWVTARIYLERRSTDAYGIVLEDGPDGPYDHPGHAVALRIGRYEPATVRYRVRIRQRGRHRVEDLVLSTRFPFGLFEHRVRHRVESEVIVFPRIGVFHDEPLPHSRFTRRMTATETVREKGQEEFRNLREYRPGDSPRLIAWKATARYGELMVKELEDDLTKRVTLFLESRLDPGAKNRDRLRLERAISFAATLLHRLAKKRYLIRLHYLGPEPMVLDAGRSARRLSRLMEGLAVLTPSETEGIQDLVARAPVETWQTSLPVFLVAKLDEERIREAFRRMPGSRPPVVFRADGIWERSVFSYHEQILGKIG